MIGYKDLPTIDADSKIELYQGCKKKYSKLSATLALLRFKVANGLSNKGFTEMLGLFKEILPEDNVLPRSMNEAKKIVYPLELEVQKIHACVNDCILYHGEYKDLRVSAFWEPGYPDLPACGPRRGFLNGLVRPISKTTKTRPSRWARPHKEDDTKTSRGSGLPRRPPEEWRFLCRYPTS
jgi:hypothetical protein